MKFILTLIFVFIASMANAKNICPVNTDIEEDMRLPESHYSKENASKAIDFLSGVVKHDKSAGEWIDVPNALKTVDGYIQKRLCVKSDGVMKNFHCADFCTFMKSSSRYD